MTKLATAHATLATRQGCSAAKAHLIGISMGGMTALRYAALNPTKVASINALVPATSIVNLQARNPGNPISGGFSDLLTQRWGGTYRTLVDGTTTSGSPTLGSAAGFTAADVGKLVVSNTAAITSGYNGKVPQGTTVLSQSGTTATMSANATATGSGLSIGLATLVPTSGSPNADILTMASAIASAGISVRLFYSTVDLFIDPADVTAMATATGGTAIAIDSTFGHSNGSLLELSNYNSGSNFSDLIANLLAHGA